MKPCEGIVKSKKAGEIRVRLANGFIVTFETERFNKGDRVLVFYNYYKCRAENVIYPKELDTSENPVSPNPFCPDVEREDGEGLEESLFPVFREV